jgi:hypothetical protein
VDVPSKHSHVLVVMRVFFDVLHEAGIEMRSRRWVEPRQAALKGITSNIAGVGLENTCQEHCQNIKPELGVSGA